MEEHLGYRCLAVINILGIVQLCGWKTLISYLYAEKLVLTVSFYSFSCYLLGHKIAKPELFVNIDK